MFTWVTALIISASCCIILITILCFTIRRRLVSNKVDVTEHPKTSFQPGFEPERRRSYLFFHRGSSAKSRLFKWADHPALITDAVENGWSRFAFTNYAPFKFNSSVRSSMFRSLRVAGDHNINENHAHVDVEDSWEVGLDSVEFMQKLHFKEVKGSNPTTRFSSVRMALPLPGPPVENSFPQEAYFEITVLNVSEKKGMVNDSDVEKANLLSQHSYSTPLRIKNSEGLVHVSTKRGGGEEQGIKMSVGLSVGGSSMVMNKLPGTYPGSIGFNSDGSVYLAGMKLVSESEKEDWARTGKVIGCGFDPRLKKVFLTLDSELVHVVQCKSDDFGMPLYPVLAANIDITLSVNLGQSSFSYAPANGVRTPNPCFTGPAVRSSPGALGYEEDSREFFSMGRLDSKWLSRHSARNISTTSTISNLNNNNDNKNNKTIEHDDDLEPEELFEIVLD